MIVNHVNCTLEDNNMDGIYVDCTLTWVVGDRKEHQGKISFMIESLYTEFYQNLKAVPLRNSVKVAVLSTFATTTRGVGKKLFCVVLMELARKYKVTHIALNAVGIPRKGIDNKKDSQKSLIRNYKRMGFKHISDTLMVGSVRVLLSKCKNIPKLTFDSISLQFNEK
jgi:hypothetical protein